MLDVKNLSLSINKKRLLTDITFQVASGEMLILLGRNGSGKTLLINILATLIEPTSGTVFISEIDAFSNLKKVRPIIGYVPVNFQGYPELSVVNYLNFFASAYQLKKQDRVSTIDAVIDLMDIQHLQDSEIGALSTGERQRLLFAKTFLHEPELWVLDEPLTPLDPRGQIEMIGLFGELQAMGKIIVIATNRLEDAAKLCNLSSDVLPKTNLIGILENGKLVVYNTIFDLKKELLENENTHELKPNWLAEYYLEVTKS